MYRLNSLNMELNREMYKEQFWSNFVFDFECNTK